MRNKYIKPLLFLMILLGSIVFTGCDGANSQNSLKLDVNEPIEALRANLQGSNQSTLLTPLANKVNFTPLHISLARLSESLRAELPTGDGTDSTTTTPATDERTEWEIRFLDLDNQPWYLKVPSNGVTFESSTEATIKAKVNFSDGKSGLDIIFNMIKEGVSTNSLWVISDIFIEESLSTVATGIAGKVTDSTNDKGIEGATITAYTVPYFAGDDPVGTTKTDVDGHYQLILPAGDYKVLISKANYTIDERQITVE